MKRGYFRFAVLVLLLSITFLLSRAAAAPYKAVYTFGGLNERSGILWVARDAGIFQKYGIDPTIVNVRNAQVGMSALAGGETHFHVGSATGTSIGAMAGGLDLAYIAGLINKLDGAFMVNPSIKTPADLKGKKIGVQSIGGGVWSMVVGSVDRSPRFTVLPSSAALIPCGGFSRLPALSMASARNW